MEDYKNNKKSISEIINDFEEKNKQPLRMSRKDSHIAAAEELTKDETIYYAFVGKRAKTNNYAVVCLTNKRIVAVQSTVLGMPESDTISWKWVTGLEITDISKIFTSGTVVIKTLSGNMVLNKISKHAIYEIEKIILDIVLNEVK